MSKEEAEPESVTPESSEDSENEQSGSTRRKSKANKPRLTATQKNTNHKDAENKRRNAIRERFTDLSHMVPGTEGQERSEQVMLQKTADFLRRQIMELRQLEAMADNRRVPVQDDERLKETDFGGSAFKQPHMEEYRAQKAKKTANGLQTAMEGDDGED
jgi:heteromeric Ino2p/Ino4p transcription factor